MTATLLRDAREWALFGVDGERCVVGIGPFEAVATLPDAEVAFYVGDFALDAPRPWRVPARFVELDSREHVAIDLAVAWQPPDAGVFEHVFAEVSRELERGAIEKTVPVMVERGRMTRGRGRDLPFAFVAERQGDVRYAWVDSDDGFAGATPELLFAKEGEMLRTMALAGTARREARAGLAISAKDGHEHALVVAALAANLGRFGVPRTHPREVVEWGSLAHLRTLLDVTVRGPWSFEPFLRSLHPTPALGPAPRTGESMAFLLELRRRLECPPEFGAPFGVLHRGRLEMVVAIRGLWWHGNDVLLPAGCGIVRGSRAGPEWTELAMKRHAVKERASLGTGARHAS